MAKKLDGRARLGWAGLFLLLAGCGGGSGPSTPTPTTTLPPPPPPPELVAQGAGLVEADATAFVTFTTTKVGRLDITVDWTLPSNDIDVFLVRGACTNNQLAQGSCPFLTFSNSVTAKPERISATNADATLYTLYTANFGATDDSVSYQIVLSPNASPLSAPDGVVVVSRGVLPRAGYSTVKERASTRVPSSSISTW